MTTLIGYRWKGSNVRSRVVLIARQACAYVRPFLVEGRARRSLLLSFDSETYLTIYMFPSFIGILFHSCQRYCGEGRGRQCPIQNLGGHGDGAHPLPFRTGKLRPFAPMVLLYQVGE